MTASKEDYQYYEQLPQQQIVPRHEGMSSRVVWKMPLLIHTTVVYVCHKPLNAYHAQPLCADEQWTITFTLSAWLHASTDTASGPGHCLVTVLRSDWLHHVSPEHQKSTDLLV